MDKWLRNKNVVRVIALMLGVLLWAVVHLGETSAPGSGFSSVQEQTIYNVRVTPVYDENRYHIVSMDTSTVMIRVSGKEAALRKISTAPYKIILNLSNANEGENTLPLIADDFPSGVDVAIFPPYSRVVLQEKHMKEVPVEVSVIGNPANGFKAGQPIAKPARVFVTVPSGLLEEEIVVKADVSVEGVQEAVVKQVRAVAFDSSGRELDLSISPPVVDIEVPITQPFKKMPLQLKVSGEPAPGFAVEQFQASLDQITVFGPQELLNTLDFYEGPQVDLGGLRASQEFKLDIPLRARIGSIDPTTVDVKVTIVPSQSQTLEQVPITVIGQNNDFDTQIVTPESGAIDVTISAAPSTLAKVRAQDVQAIVDVSNLPPGEHNVAVNVSLPQFVKRVSGSMQVTIQITAKGQQTAAANIEPVRYVQ